MSRPRALLDSALLADAFAADGLHGTSSARLAAALGVAKPTLYAHTAGKTALFLLAVEGEVERVLDRLAAAEARTAGRSARERATGAAHALLDHAAQRPLGARLLARTAAHERSDVAERVAASVARVPARMAASLARDLANDGLDPSPAGVYASALHAAATALAELAPADRRMSRARAAAVAAALVPERPVLSAADWPSA